MRRAGTTALGFSLFANKATFAAARPTPSAVILGAGLAGLIAAYTLERAGWSVTLLEARDRIGGRVLSHRMGASANLVCELGGEWIGASHERVQALCKEFSLELTDHRFTTSLMLDGAVSPPDKWRFSPFAESAFADFKRRYVGYTQAQRERLDRVDWWTCLERIGFTPDDLRLRDLMDSTDFGESIRHVSAYAAASEYFESSPANEMDFKIRGGNSRLPEELAKRLHVGTLRLNMPVEEIHERGGRVIVTAKGVRFAADKCICTLPARAVRHLRFDPPLPPTQAAALESLQYARIIKNSILFRERFWRTEDFSLVTDATSHYYFHSTKNQAGTEGILCSYAIGEKADVLAAQGDRRRLDLTTRDLVPLDARAPQLATAIASYAWQRDPYTEGAYALYRPGQWFTIRPTLARPHGRVLFAGEHLADWQGFMEGAIVTGEAAAQELISERRPRSRAARLDNR